MKFPMAALRYSRLLVLLAATIACPALQAQSESGVDALAEQIRQTDAQLEALKQTIDENTQLKEELQVAFEAARERRGERTARLGELDQQIDDFSGKLDALSAELDAAGNDIEQRKSELALALRSSQQIGADSGLKALLQHDDPALAQRLETYRAYFFKAQRRKILAAVEYLEKIEEAHLTTLKDRNWLLHIRDKANTQRDGFEQDVAAKRQQIDTVDAELEDSSRTVAQLQQDQQRLQSLMEELESSQRQGSGYFASLQGQYQLPANGEITARFGDRKSVGKVQWNGLFITASSGTPVQAVADGEVVYSDWLQGFGMLVIMDHGDGYMTLYGGNRSVITDNGSWVQAGSTIATVGDSGGQNTSGLYFEIRHNATALDPMDWLNKASS